MIRRLRLLILAMMGRGYPKVIFIEAGEDPTKNRLPIIAPVNISLIITVVVFACSTPVLAAGMYPIFFPPKPTPTPTTTATPELLLTEESTAEATVEITSTPTQTSTSTPVVIVVTATPTPTETPTFTHTPTPTSTSTATETPVELWPVWMTGTAIYKEMNPPVGTTPVIMTIKETVVVTQIGYPGRDSDGE